MRTADDPVRGHNLFHSVRLQKRRDFLQNLRRYSPQTRVPTDPHYSATYYVFGRSMSPPDVEKSSNSNFDCIRPVEIEIAIGIGVEFPPF